MLKIETIWHYLLYEVLEKGRTNFTQQDLAKEFGFSTSTVHHALDVPTQLGAVRKTGKGFALDNYQKLLYYWASVRRLERDIIFSCYVDKDVRQIESTVPPESIFAGYSAYRMRYQEPAGDYSKVHIYLEKAVKQEIFGRMDIKQSDKDREPNFFVLKKSPDMEKYGKITTIPQTFVDIWNLSDWYSGEFVTQLKEKMHGLLS